MSEYVNGPFGSIMTAAMAFTGLGAICLALGLWRSVTPSFWLVLACAGTLTAGVGYLLLAACPVDAAAPATVPGALHNVFGGYSHLFATASVFMFPLAFRECRRWRPFFGPALVAALVVLGVYFGIHMFLHGGLSQRLWAVTTTACSLVVAVRLARSGLTRKFVARESP